MKDNPLYDDPFLRRRYEADAALKTPYNGPVSDPKPEGAALIEEDAAFKQRVEVLAEMRRAGAHHYASYDETHKVLFEVVMRSIVTDGECSLSIDWLRMRTRLQPGGIMQGLRHIEADGFISGLAEDAEVLTFGPGPVPLRRPTFRDPKAVNVVSAASLKLKP